MDTQEKNLCVECTNKEISIRFAWYLKYSQQFAKKSLELKPKKIGLSEFGDTYYTKSLT